MRLMEVGKKLLLMTTITSILLTALSGTIRAEYRDNGRSYTPYIQKQYPNGNYYNWPGTNSPWWDTGWSMNVISVSSQYNATDGKGNQRVRVFSRANQLKTKLWDTYRVNAQVLVQRFDIRLMTYSNTDDYSGTTTAPVQWEIIETDPVKTTDGKVNVSPLWPVPFAIMDAINPGFGGGWSIIGDVYENLANMSVYVDGVYEYSQSGDLKSDRTISIRKGSGFPWSEVELPADIPYYDADRAYGADGKPIKIGDGAWKGGARGVGVNFTYRLPSHYITNYRYVAWPQSVVCYQVTNLDVPEWYYVWTGASAVRNTIVNTVN